MVKIDRKVSLGNIITIFVIIVNIIWSASLVTTSTKNAEIDSNMALNLAQDNRIRIAIIETKIEEGFKNIEKLIKELKDD